jgi:DNA-binding MarR family transcriptional regulator
MVKLDTYGVEQSISVKEKQLLYIVESNAGIKTSEIAKKLGMSNSTVKRMLDKLITLKLIERQGIGPGSYYNLL